MKVAIVVLHYQGAEDTVECLSSLKKVAFPAALYVVDNGSRPPLRSVLGDLGAGVRLIENPENLGFSGGHNVGLRAALADGAEYVLLLNNDTIVDPGFLDPMVAAMDADPCLGMAAPKIYFHGLDRVFWAYGADVGRWTARSPHIGVYQKDGGQFDRLREVDRVTGCAMLVRRSLIERAGMLDERFFAYSEEVDWCLRARRAGFRVGVVSDSVIWHKGHRSAGRIGRAFTVHLRTRNQFLLLRKNSDSFAFGGAFAAIYLFLWAAAQAVSFLTRTKGGDGVVLLRALGRGIVDGMRGRFGPPVGVPR